MFWTGIAFLIIISLAILGSLIVSIMGTFGWGGGMWDWFRSLIDWSWLQTYQAFVAGSIGACLLLWAAVVAMFQLRAARRTSYADLLVRLAEEWNSDSFIVSRQLMMELAPVEMDQEEQRRKVTERMRTTEQKSDKDYFLLTRPLDFFEGLAFLIRQHYIPLEDACRTFGGPMITYYKLFEDYVEEMRQEPGNEDAYKELEKVIKNLIG